MKLALIRQRYNPYGGAERFVERALAALVAEGVEVDLITRNWEGAPAAGFRQITCDPPYSRLLGGRAARDRSFAEAAQALMAQGGYQITQSHERIPGCMIFRAGDGVHAAWLEHRARQLTAPARLAQRLSPYHRYVLGAERAMLEHPALAQVICNSRLVAQELQDYYGLPAARIALIYNGVDTAHFHPDRAAARRAAQRARLGLDRHTPLLLLVGSGFERKGVPALLQAMVRMRRQDAQLVVVGADRKLAAMAQRAARLGLAARVPVRRPGAGCAALVWRRRCLRAPLLVRPRPQRRPGSDGLRPAPAHQHQLRRPGLGRSRQNGWVTDALDIAALAHALDELCELASQPGARQAARAAVQHLSLDAMSAHLIALYHRLLPAAKV